MSDVTITFSGDDKDAQKAWDRQAREIAKLKEKVAELGRVSKKAGDDGKRGFDGQIGSLTKMVEGFANVGTAVGAVSAAYEKWHERMRRLAQDSNKFHSDLLRTLNKAGDLASGAEVKQAMRSVPGAKQEEALAAFSAISDAAPGSDRGRRLGLMKNVARLGPIVGGTSGVGAMGAVAGELSEQFPGTSPEDLTDLALKLQEQVGGDAEKLSSSGFLRGANMLTATGATDMNTALATGAHAMTQEMDPRLVEKMAGAISGRAGNIKKGGSLSADQKLKNKFGGMSAPEAFQALLSDSALRNAVMGDTGGAKGGQLDLATIKQLAADQKSAMAGDEVGKRLGIAAAQDPATFRQHEAEIQRERAGFAVEDKTRAMEASLTEREGSTVGMHFMDASQHDVASKIGEVGASTLGFENPTAAGTKVAEMAPSWGSGASGVFTAGTGIGPMISVLEKIRASIDGRKPIVKGGEQ